MILDKSMPSTERPLLHSVDDVIAKPGPSMTQPQLEIGDAPKAVYDRVRDQILTGHLPAGEPVKIQAVAEELGVSIVPVREAIRMLAAEGLLTLRPRRSPIVAKIELSEILEINNIRLALEPFFLAAAIEHHTDESVALCQALVAADEAANDYNEKVELNRRFHLALLEPAGQPRALKIIDEQFESISWFAQMMVLRGQHNMSGHVHTEHLEILDAVQERKTGEAVKRLEEHISSAGKRIARELERQRQSKT